MSLVTIIMRFVCLYMPDFLLQANLRDERGEAGSLDQAIALVDGAHPRVIAATRAACESGVLSSMTKSQAAERAVIRHRSKAQEDSAHAALLDCARSCSPRVEDTARDTIVIDLEGLEKLLGPPATIAARLLRQAEGLGLRIHLAIAANPDTAILSACGFRGVTIIPPGEEAQKLGELPVRVIHSQPDTLDILHRWGIDRLKELATLPALPLSERLGQEGVHLQKLSCGKHFRALIVAQEAESFEESWELETPARTLDELDFVLSSVLTRLSKRLSIRSLAAEELRLRLELVEGIEPEPSLALEEQERQRQETRDERQVMAVDSSLASRLLSLSLRFPLPLNNAGLFFKLWRLRLESDLPRAPVAKITVSAEPARPRLVQGGLFAPLAPDPEKLELTLARLGALVGSGNVGTPELLDTHRPHAFRVTAFDPAAPKSKIQNPKSDVVMALRLFRPPVRMRVELSSGRPLRLSSRKVCGKVLSAAGPWRKSGGWWEEEKWERDEWDVEIRRGKTAVLYLLYRDLTSDEWYLQGEYD